LLHAEILHHLDPLIQWVDLDLVDSVNETLNGALGYVHLHAAFRRDDVVGRLDLVVNTLGEELDDVHPYRTIVLETLQLSKCFCNRGHEIISLSFDTRTLLDLNHRE
jgi:hypothetical protein